MTEIKLRTLEIEHFKGIRYLHLDFKDGVNSLYGDNATGKTTVYDALMWLLFGKDSAGRAAFSIKPVGAASGVMPTVSGTIEINGIPRRLKKCMRERWERPRGTSIERFAGNTVDHFVDDVPYTESGYKQLIGGYVDEKKFRLLTGVYAIARDLPWKDRRKLLGEVCGMPDDADILASTPAYRELYELIGQRTVDEYKAVLLAERKQRNTDLNALPIRIDECEKRARDLDVLNYSKAEADKAELDARSADLRREIAQLDGDALLAAAEAEKTRLSASMRELDAENAAHRASQTVPMDADPRPALEQRLTESRASAERIRDELARCSQAIQSGNARLEEYRAAWHRIDCEVFAASVCPTCGQALPADQLAEARLRFDADKDARKNRLIQDSALLKQSIQADTEKSERLKGALKDQEREQDTLRRKISGYQPTASPVIDDLPDYAARKAALESQYADAASKAEQLRADKQVVRQSLQDALRQVTGEIEKVGRVLAARDQLAETRKRIAELTDEQRRVSAQMEDLDRRIKLCEDFTRWKVRFVEDGVNDKFRLARFRLFTEQLNGGLADCCDVTVGGVPYGDLNSASRINVGLDIIETLSAHYGLRVPLFVDNAESVTHLQDVGTQVVRLVVSEHDKELRMA